MEHDVTLAGHAFSLRPVHYEDAEFIVSLRNDSRLNKYLHSGASAQAAQTQWLESYFTRSGDYYFVVEQLVGGAREGLVAIYNKDDDANTAEWGRWVLRPGSFAAIESAWLSYRVGFEILNLESLYCRTVVENRSVVSFHDSCGAPRRRTLVDHFELSGRKFDAVEHCVDRGIWDAMNSKLENLAKGLARRINGEK